MVREGFDVDWALAFQRALKDIIRANFPNDVDDWPLLQGLRLDTHQLPSHLVLVLHHVPQRAALVCDSAPEPIVSAGGPADPPNATNVVEWHQYLRVALGLDPTDAVVIVPLSDGSGITDEWASWDEPTQAMWHAQLDYVAGSQVKSLVSEGRSLVPIVDTRRSQPPLQSSIYQRDPDFPEPENLEVSLWRYMSFTKYVSLLDERALYFSRADQLGDPYEGSTSTANLDLRPTVYGDKLANKFSTQQVGDFLRRVRAHVFINCWYMAEFESAAMWSLYSDGGPSIAIRTTFRGLVESLGGEHPILCGKVKYIDYASEWMPEGNLLYPFIHKRRSYEHEREVRAILMDIRLDTDRLSVDSHSGRYVPVDFEKLIHSIYIAPAAPAWFAKLVQSVTHRYGLTSVQIIQSELDKEPVY